MTRPRHPAAPWALLLFAATGCVATTPELDRHFGESVKLLQAQQTLRPDAVRNADPVAGVDGKAAKAAYERYQKSFATPEPQADAFTIGVGKR
ncbi:pilus assembly protein [Janthinobacterium fluminis]|uniref:Pilus assembly protein n=1 Tax=Janthinobacterium fluminis TaxID=2987524 RepID=A0ABT5K451_9BURK|nr:pilus assembly protein [Janthinobacterium fluminis]MDC8759250.1 pilus assembly protein [Janthinobacterium fluminis]